MLCKHVTISHSKLRNRGMLKRIRISAYLDKQWIFTLEGELILGDVTHSALMGAELILEDLKVNPSMLSYDNAITTSESLA